MLRAARVVRSRGSFAPREMGAAWHMRARERERIHALLRSSFICVFALANCIPPWYECERECDDGTRGWCGIFPDSSGFSLFSRETAREVNLDWIVSGELVCGLLYFCLAGFFRGRCCIVGD